MRQQQERPVPLFAQGSGVLPWCRRQAPGHCHRLFSPRRARGRLHALLDGHGPALHRQWATAHLPRQAAALWRPRRDGRKLLHRWGQGVPGPAESLQQAQERQREKQPRLSSQSLCKTQDGSASASGERHAASAFPGQVSGGVHGRCDSLAKTAGAKMA
mmetsp:Transcript_21782/g.61884  ORF Transcript_21782/g.61884 Transcript_21782/m.61884 type:complete len:159 (-) Transcript_21782:12-488(-)